MPKLLAFSTLPGDPPIGPIQPSGGDPFQDFIHNLGQLDNAQPSSAVPFRSLSDLRFGLPVNANPQSARIAVYQGVGQNPHPLFLIETHLQRDGASKNVFKMLPIIAKAAAPLVVAGNTVGIEVRAGSGSIIVTSVLRRGRTKPKKGGSTKMKKKSAKA